MVIGHTRKLVAGIHLEATHATLDARYGMGHSRDPRRSALLSLQLTTPRVRPTPR
jgi:hypothetical protein